MFKQFRAKNIPWRILIPRFKMMMERDEHEREVRIRRNAEVSYKNARLPPRMQAHADKMKKDDLDSTQPSQSSAGLQFSFQPVRARSVPDFRRLQKTFISKMEQLKKSKNPTQPIPFKFSLARPSAHLRTHMDQQNQAINPTLKRQRAHSARPPIAPPVEQPATTAKHDARVEMRRQQMEQKKAEQSVKYQQDYSRLVKQHRLKQRVKCSPAIVSNSANLAKQREAFKRNHKEELLRHQRNYENMKAQM